MNIWLIILLAGLGTYLMRSVGIWATIQSPWLHHIPFAVILVMAISGVVDVSQTPPETTSAIAFSSAQSAIAATIVIIIASVFKFPLVLRIALGCLVFGAMSV